MENSKKFKLIEFAEFLGSKGKNVTIVEEEGKTSFQAEAMKVSQFQEYLKEYMLKEEKENVRK